MTTSTPSNQKPKKNEIRAIPKQAKDNLAEYLGDMVWTRRNSRAQLKVIVVQSVVIAALVVAVAIVATHKEPPVYFASTPDLRVIKLSPLSSPALTDDAVISWVSGAVVRSMSLDFVHWRETLTGVRGDYSASAFDLFVTNLKASGLLPKVVDEKLVLSVVPESAPIITNKGVLGGNYVWKLKFPLVVTYQGSSGSLGTQKYTATVTVQRASTAVHPQGVVIQQIVLE